MTKLELKEKYKIDDSHSKVRGIVTMKCLDDGKVLFTKENTVVREGRNLLLKNIFGNTTPVLPTFWFYMSTEDAPEQATDRYFPNVEAGICFKQKVIFQNDDSLFLTNAELATYDTMPTQRGTTAFSVLETEGNDEPAVKVTNHIQILIDPQSLTNDTEILEWDIAKCAGLMFNDGTNKLFSRVTFEGIALKESAKYLIDYYIYF